MQLFRKKELGVHKKYVYLLALIISAIVLLQISNTRDDSLVYFIGHIVLFGSNYLVWAYFIEYINGAIQPENFKENLWKGIGRLLLLLAVLVFVNLLITNILYYAYISFIEGQNFFEAIAEFKPYIAKSAIRRLIDLLLIIILLRVVNIYISLQDKKLQVMSLEKDLHQTQLLALQSQLNPHFLFNALHTVHSLIGFEDDKAKSMVIKMTHLLRKILTHNETPFISFQEEIEYFETYLDIEQERFNDRLTVNTNIDPQTLQIQVPTLFLQPLIENAFKHGVSQIDGKAVIDLDAKMKDNSLWIQLSNSIPKGESKTAANSTKIGLKNLRDRLHNTYGNHFKFTTETIDNKFVATLFINKPNDFIYPNS